MIFDEQAIEAAAKAICENACKLMGHRGPENTVAMIGFKAHATAALQAALDSLKERGLVREGNASDPCDQWFAQAPVIADGGETFPVLIAKVQP